jgi:hypothetical protein
MRAMEGGHLSNPPFLLLWLHRKHEDMSEALIDQIAKDSSLDLTQQQ